MLLFWILAAALSGLAALLMLFRAARAERASAPDDPELEVYRRQLAEIDELAERGLLGPDEQRAAHAEAGRRLLGQAGRSRSEAAAPTANGRRWVMAAAVAAPLLALGGYLVLGSPGFPDQPYKERLKGWVEASRNDPGKLTLPELRAVLELIVAQNPKDQQPLLFLAKVEDGQGDLPAAVRTLETATSVAPNSAQAWVALGENLTAMAGGQPDEEARAAFQRASALDPNAPEPRYWMARAQIAAGQTAQGLQVWKSVAVGLPPDDPRRAGLQAEIAGVEKTGRLSQAPTEAPAGAPGEGAQQAAFIQSMVDGLAAKLKANPDDPEGWARLIRAYGVLGQTQRRDAAIAEARRLFKDRPDALKTALAGQAVPAPQ
jgi:cytochrome c-type biogenesis protein CcmH